MPRFEFASNALLGVVYLAGTLTGLAAPSFADEPVQLETIEVIERSDTLIGIGYKLDQRWRVGLEVLNLLDAEDSDIEYFYPSRLPGEPLAGVEDIHFHPVEPLSVRLSLTAYF